MVKCTQYRICAISVVIRFKLRFLWWHSKNRVLLEKERAVIVNITWDVTEILSLTYHNEWGKHQWKLPRLSSFFTNLCSFIVHLFILLICTRRPGIVHIANQTGQDGRESFEFSPLKGQQGSLNHPHSIFPPWRCPPWGREGKFPMLAI